MGRVEIRKARRADLKQFIGLVGGLARFERLEPPSAAGRRRLADDILKKKRINLFIAADRDGLVGYALYFYTYSSFLAKPTFYLEDLFVLEKYRKRGIGFALFRKCVEEAMTKGCGRMEWAVLTWNQKALEFYERLGARRMSDWYVYRLDEKGLKKVPRALS
jgi:GNAT superfamily N-acetyltransferase